MSTLDLVVNKENEFKTTLWGRMDETASLVRLDPYQLMRLDDSSKAVDHVVNVTLNSPAVLANSVATVLLKSVMQTWVQGIKNNRSMTEKEASEIEHFLDANYEQADDLLVAQNKAMLKNWLSNHFVVRGWAGALYWPYIEDGVYYPEIIPWDMRYVSYEYGRRELNWAAYRTFRSPASIMAEYDNKDAQDPQKGWVAPSGWSLNPSATEPAVDQITYVDGEKQDIWIAGVHIKSVKHNWGRVPAVIQAAPTGFMLRDKGYLTHEGEDVLQFNRELFAEKNRNASIDQTLAMKTILPPEIAKVANPNQEEAVPYADKVGTTTEIGINESIDLLRQPDLNNAALRGGTEINSAIAEGGLNSVDKGEVNMPSSAVSIAALQEIRSKLQEPFLQSLSMFRQQLSPMMIDFYQMLYKQNPSIKVGSKGKRKTYTDKDFEGDYSIRYRFMTKDKQEEIANIAVYQATKGEIPLEIRVSELLKYADPHDFIAKLNAEQAEAAEPAIKLKRMAHALVDEAQELEGEAKDELLLESRMLSERADIMLRQRFNPQAPLEEETPTGEQGNSALLMPLIGQGGMGRATAETQEVSQ